jgi:teichuronic acid biosynthesis glycosyltransferase TuaH
MTDLIFVSLEDWDDIWRRNQFVCAELARRHPQARILFVAPPRNFSRDLATLNVKNLRGRSVTKPRGFDNIIVFRPEKLLPNSLSFGRSVNAAILRRQVRKMSAKLRMHRPLLWLNSEAAVHLVGRMSESASVYDITDDWISFQRDPKQAELVRRNDRELCQKADAVIVCSQRLFEMKQSIAGGKLHLIPNGVDAAHYSAMPSSTTSKWQKPVFGYTGTVHPERLDLELIQAVAKKLKQGTLVFVGPNHLLEPQKNTLLSTGRVAFGEPVPYERIPQIMAAFDVCIAPHRTSQFVESLQPIKLWEYLAVGKPIVATDISGFRDYPNLVRIARSADEFAGQLLAALDEGALLTPQRQAIARDNSWQDRVDSIESVLNKITNSAEVAHA